MIYERNRRHLPVRSEDRAVIWYLSFGAEQMKQFENSSVDATGNQVAAERASGRHRAWHSGMGATSTYSMAAAMRWAYSCSKRT
ncbi:hypothetical protein GCM10027287_46430 [Bordetella muralis]